MNERSYSQSLGRAQYADAPSEPKQSMIGTLCSANSTTVRVLEALLALQYKLGIAVPTPPSESSNQIKQTPSLLDISFEITARLQSAEKMICEIHEALGDR